MKNLFFKKAKDFGNFLCFGLLLFTVQAFLSETSFAQAKKAKPAGKESAAAKSAADLNLPKVTQIDLIAFKNLLQRGGENPKPLLINFWATWCDPCRAEFPDLVKINAEYKGKIDFITISLDDLVEIDRDVPKFLGEMRATMPAYLLKTDDEGEAIGAISEDWSGGLPFTVLFNGKGEIAYSRQGVIKPDILRAELEKLFTTDVAQSSVIALPKPKIRSSEDGRTDAKNDIAKGWLKIKRYGLTPAIPQSSLQKLKKKYGIEIVENGCALFNVDENYFTAYNAVMRTEILNKFGLKVLDELGIN